MKFIRALHIYRYLAFVLYLGIAGVAAEVAFFVYVIFSYQGFDCEISTFKNKRGTITAFDCRSADDAALVRGVVNPRLLRHDTLQKHSSKAISKTRQVAQRESNSDKQRMTLKQKFLFFLLVLPSTLVTVVLVVWMQASSTVIQTTEAAIAVLLSLLIAAGGAIAFFRKSGTVVIYPFYFLLFFYLCLISLKNRFLVHLPDLEAVLERDARARRYLVANPPVRFQEAPGTLREWRDRHSHCWKLDLAKHFDYGTVSVRNTHSGTKARDSFTIAMVPNGVEVGKTNTASGIIPALPTPSSSHLILQIGAQLEGECCVLTNYPLPRPQRECYFEVSTL